MMHYYMLALLTITGLSRPHFLCARNTGGEPLTLEKAVEIALTNNHNLRAAGEYVQAAGLRTRRARLDLLPKADLQLSYSRLDPATVRRGNVFVDVGRSLLETFAPESDPNDIRPGAYRNNFGTVLQVVQPLYNGGANWARVGLARAQQSAVEHSFEDTRQAIILQTKSRYLQVLQAQELVALASKSLESSRRHLVTAKNMLEVGMRSRTEVLRWEVQAADREGQLRETENSLKIATAALKQTLAVPFESEFTVQPLDAEPEPLPDSLPRQTSLAQAAHPGLQAALAAVDAGRAGVRLAWASFQPQVNFVYQLGWERNNTINLDSFTFWSAGVSVNIPIFHSFSNLTRLHEQKAEVRRLQENRDETERILTLHVIRARSNVATALQRYHIAQKTVELAQENLQVLDNTFEAGLAANIDVLDGQVVLTEAETSLIQARYQYWIARAELERAMGVLR